MGTILTIRIAEEIMKNFVGMSMIVAASIGIMVAAQPAGAQQVIGFDPMVGPICNGPLGVAPCQVIHEWMMRQRVQAMPQRIDNGMGIDFRPIGPAAGAAVARGLAGFGVPAPVAGWAGSRVEANAASAGRERNLLDAGIRTVLGPSMRDIREEGILGGRCSVLRNPFGGGC